MDRAELARRLKAARALGGFTKPVGLARHPLLVENGIKDWKIRDFESLNGRTEPRPMELEVIAQACGLPAEWFSAPFERLAERTAASERLEELAQAVEALAGRVPEPEQLRRELARQAAEDAAASGAPAHSAPKRTG